MTTEDEEFDLNSAQGLKWLFGCYPISDCPLPELPLTGLTTTDTMPPVILDGPHEVSRRITRDNTHAGGTESEYERSATKERMSDMKQSARGSFKA